MEEDWVWLPDQAAVPAIHMAVSVRPPAPAPASRPAPAPCQLGRGARRPRAGQD